mgnify:CR=1 FL=1
MGVFALFTGKVNKKYGAKKAILACLILIGVATCMRVFAYSVSTLLISSLFIGRGLATSLSS